MLISSVNLTANSLGWGTHSSLEAGLRIDAQADVAAWASAVMALWDACPFRLHLLGADVSLQQEGVTGIKLGRLEVESSPGCHMAWSLPPVHHGICNQLVALCDSAMRQIIFAAMSFYDIDRVPLLHSAIRRALQRGVKVAVVVRPEHFKQDQYPDASTQALIEKGLELLGCSGLHAKGASADSTRTAILSANFNPFSLESDDGSAHVECAMLCWHPYPSCLGEYGRLLDWLVNHPTHRYVVG